MTDLAREQTAETDPDLVAGGEPSTLRQAWDRIARVDRFDLGAMLLLAVLAVLVLATFRDYAITNDEWIQHRYGELIIAYYKSGFTDRSVFQLDNLYLYGGLFDIVAVLLSHVSPLDPFDLRHLMSALIGVGGLGAALITARLIAGPRAGLIAGVALAICGSWYGTMFHHTKDVPLGAAMAGALYFLVRASRDLPQPRLRHVVGFGALTGMALGIKVLGLLLLCYVPVAIVLSVPPGATPRAFAHFSARSLLGFLPGFAIAYLIMALAWPWSVLAPLNPIRGLFDFGEFHYNIRTVLAGEVYRMATVPRWYVPAYLVVKLPLVVLAGAALCLAFAALPRLAGETFSARRRRDIILVATAALFPVLCEVVVRGPAFCGLRHFLFVLPPLAVLAGIGIDAGVRRLTMFSPHAALAALAMVAMLLAGNAVTLYRLHPYEYLVYNRLVGGLHGASRRYVMDYWVTMMPEAVDGLEAYLAHTEPATLRDPRHFYTVSFCGERAAFVKKAPPYLHWAQTWETADFFIAPTHMNCDRDSRGKVVVAVTRMGVPIGFVKDQRPMLGRAAKRG